MSTSCTRKDCAFMRKCSSLDDWFELLGVIGYSWNTTKSEDATSNFQQLIREAPLCLHCIKETIFFLQDICFGKNGFGISQSEIDHHMKQSNRLFDQYPCENDPRCVIRSQDACLSCSYFQLDGLQQILEHHLASMQLPQYHENIVLDHLTLYPANSAPLWNALDPSNKIWLGQSFIDWMLQWFCVRANQRFGGPVIGAFSQEVRIPGLQNITVQLDLNSMETDETNPSENSELHASAKTFSAKTIMSMIQENLINDEIRNHWSNFDLIIVPINTEGNHWVCGFLDFTESSVLGPRAIAVNTSHATALTKKRIFESLILIGHSIQAHIGKWTNAQGAISEWRRVYLNVPEQNDTWACGYHLLWYAEEIINTILTGVEMEVHTGDSRAARRYRFLLSQRLKAHYEGKPDWQNPSEEELSQTPEPQPEKEPSPTSSEEELSPAPSIKKPSPAPSIKKPSPAPSEKKPLPAPSEKKPSPAPLEEQPEKEPLQTLSRSVSTEL